MADTIIQLPYTGTTSGDLLDATSLVVGANTVKRERMVISNDASTAVAVVTSSGDLRVQIQAAASVTLSSNPVASQIISLSSGTVTLSSNPTVISASSGLVQVLQSTGAWAVTGGGSTVVSLSSNPTVVSASSGFVQVYQSTSPWAVSLSSGTVTLSSAIGISSGLITLTGTNVVGISSGTIILVASSGGAIPATSSGGLGVSILGGAAGSTGVSLFGSSGVIAQITSSGGMWVQITGGGSGSTSVSIEGAAGVEAPVSSSEGLSVSLSLPVHLHTQLSATGIVPTLFQITTAPARVYSINAFSTQTVANYMEFYNNGTTVLTAASTFIVGTNPITVGGFQNIILSVAGIACTGGITAVSRLTLGSTIGATAVVHYGIEYSI